MVAGSARAIQQCLKAGPGIDLALVHVLHGEGIRLFENSSQEQIELEKISVMDAPGVTHFKFPIVKQDSRKRILISE